MKNSLEVQLESETQMREFGRKVGRTLRGNETIGLVGELGAGKTQLVKGLADGYGVQGNVISPTFVLERIYHSPDRSKSVHHLDSYRITPEEFVNLGVEDYLGKTVVVVEWANLVDRWLPDDTIWIRIINTGENNRSAEISYAENQTYIIRDL